MELEQLGEVFAEIHLVDLEPSAVAGAISRQPPWLRQKLVPQTPVDLAVLSAKRALKWQRRPPGPAELEAAALSAREGLLRRLPGPFDVVVSACVITQLGFALSQTFAESHPLLGALRLHTARLHLQTLVELTAPGGSGLFVSDLASSTHYPLEQLPADAKLAEVLKDVVAKRAFYHLARPDMVEQLLGELSPESALTRLEPWLWTGPRDRTYLVYALALRRG